MFSKKKRSRIFIRFMLSYAALLAVILGVFGVAYGRIRSMAYREWMEREIMILERGQAMIDERMREVENVILQLSHSRMIRTFWEVSSPLSDTGYYLLYDLYENLPNYGITNAFFSELIVYFPASDTLISTFGATADPATFYGTHLIYEGMPPDEWRRALLGGSRAGQIWPSSCVSVNGAENRLLTYVRSIPVEFGEGRLAVIAVLIEEKRVLEYFATSGSAGERFEVTDGSENVILSTERRNGDPSSKTITIETVSPRNGWIYTLEKPASTMLMYVGNIRNLFLLLSAIALAAGLCAALYLSHRNSIPIRRLVDRISKRDEARIDRNESELDVIEGAVSNLLSHNSMLKAEMTRRIPLLRAGFFEKLLRGGFYTDEEVEALLPYLGLSFDDSGYRIGLIRLTGHEREVSEQDIRRIDSERIIAKKVLSDFSGPGCYFHEKDTDKIVLFWKTGGFDADRKLEEIMNEAALDLIRGFGIRIACGIGERRIKLLDAHASLGEAQNAIDHLDRAPGRQVHWFEGLPRYPIGYHYPIEIESRLYNLVRIGESAEAHHILDEVFEENFGERALATDDMRRLMEEMKGTASKLRDEILVNGSRHKCVDLNKMISSIDTCASTEELSAAVKDCITLLCDTVNERKRSHNLELVNRIKEYIRSNYRDPNLTLYMVASSFGLTETYLSQFFKEQTGENYSAFLEKVRIHEARRLLLEEGVSVAASARSVGYLINSTFYRAFKRIFGMSPSTYREQVRRLGLEMPGSHPARIHGESDSVQDLSKAI